MNFDRQKEDVGNVQLLEHVNVTVPDQSLAALFYFKDIFPSLNQMSMARAFFLDVL